MITYNTKSESEKLAVVVHIFNSSYSGGRGRRISSPRLLAKVVARPCLKNKQATMTGAQLEQQSACLAWTSIWGSFSPQVPLQKCVCWDQNKFCEIYCTSLVFTFLKMAILCNNFFFKKLRKPGKIIQLF
jgi:hypothetical protein